MTAEQAIERFVEKADAGQAINLKNGRQVTIPPATRDSILSSVRAAYRRASGTSDLSCVEHAPVAAVLEAAVVADAREHGRTPAAGWIFYPSDRTGRAAPGAGAPAREPSSRQGPGSAMVEARRRWARKSDCACTLVRSPPQTEPGSGVAARPEHDATLRARNSGAVGPGPAAGGRRLHRVAPNVVGRRNAGARGARCTRRAPLVSPGSN
jgi:hypothetical protein